MKHPCRHCQLVMQTRYQGVPWQHVQFGIHKRRFEDRNIPVRCVIWDTPLNKHQIPETSICQLVVKCEIHHQKNAHRKNKSYRIWWGAAIPFSNITFFSSIYPSLKCVWNCSVWWQKKTRHKSNKTRISYSWYCIIIIQIYGKSLST